MVEPLISVVIPTYNRADLVTRAAQSVIDQTYRNTEIIVVDDESTDDTCERLSGFSNQIKYLPVSHLGGSGGRARNVGIEASHGEYIAFLDSDDEWLPDKLAKQVALLDNSNTDVVYCDASYIDDNDTIIKLQRGRHRGNILRPLLVDNVVSGSASAVLLRRSCFSRVPPFRADLESRDDWDLWLRLAFHFNFDYVPEPLVRIRVHAANISNMRRASEARSGIMTIYDGLLADPDAKMYTLRRWRDCLSTVSYFAGNVYYQNGDTLAARREFLASIRHMPLQTRAYVALLISFLGASTVMGAKRVRTRLNELLFKNP